MSKKKDPTEVRDKVYFEVGDYDVQSDLRLNTVVLNKGYGPYNRDGYSNLRYDFVELSCTIIGTNDKKRLAAPLRMTLDGEPDDLWYRGRHLDDIVRRNKDGLPVLKRRRGLTWAIYDKPEPLGALEKVRGEKLWDGYLLLPVSYLRDILALLYAGKQVYGSVTEIKKGRRRIVENVGFSTKHPDER